MPGALSRPRVGFLCFSAQPNRSPACCEGQPDLADALIGEGYLLHGLPGPEVSGRDGFTWMVAMYRAAFPDLTWIVHDQVAEGDLVATRWSTTGTHKGEFMDVPGTGVYRETRGMTFDRIANGQAVEAWAVWNTLGLLQAIGLIPVG